jgi:serine/threonine protein kinase
LIDSFTGARELIYIESNTCWLLNLLSSKLNDTYILKAMNKLSNQVLHDRYRIQSLLGRKAGRRTFLANDLQTHSPVVIKLLLFGPDFSWEDLKLFEREAETLKTLDHPSIPQYLDSFEVDTELGKGFALVQSYIEARSLQEWLQARRNFSEEDLKVIATELLGILDYLHTRQPPVIHRDIKPANILLGDRSGNSPGKIYLVDFGSVQTTIHGGTITVVGTYGYMPPEQFGGKTTSASDLYSLGATLIYLLTGTHPADLPSRKGRIQFEAEQTSEQFQTWLKYLIQPDVNQRLESAQSALKALQNDRLMLSFNTVGSKPSGTRVMLAKTNEQLKIVIPPISLGQKFQIIYSAFGPTILELSLLLLGFLKLELGLLVAPLVLWLLWLTWVDIIYKLFAKMQLSIDESKINLTLSWLGFKKRYSSPTQDIIKLDRLDSKIDRQNLLRYSRLYLWVGNQRYSLGEFNPMSKKESTLEENRLTELELDWLAVELSDWLDLPIQKSDEVMTSDLPSRVSTEETNTQSSPAEKTSDRAASVILGTPNEPSRISRPENALCTIKKYAETIEIYAPLPDGMYGCLLCFVGVLCLFFYIAIVSINPVVAFFVGCIVNVILWWNSQDLRIHSPRPSRIVLRIDPDDISLWKLSRSQQWHCLNKTDRSSIYKLQLVYKRQHYHVKVCTRYSHKDSFLIGNRSYWLSRIEAEWLAHELGIWLKLPVTEVQVVESSSS